MVLGMEPSQQWHDLKNKQDAARPPAPPPPPTAALVAGLIVPGAILALVDRRRNPLVWWGLGMGALAFQASRIAISASK